MKNIYLFLIWFTPIFVIGQTNDLYFDEVSIGGNQSNIKLEEKNSKTHTVVNLLGATINGYHTFLNQKPINILTGFEYNLLNYKTKWDLENGNVNQVYKLHQFSLPLLVRAYVGHDIKMFVEAGGVYDFINLLNIQSDIQTVDFYNNDVVKKVNQFSTGFGYGLNAGFGVIIKGVKADYVLRFSVLKSFKSEKRQYDAYYHLLWNTHYANSFKLTLGLKLN